MKKDRIEDYALPDSLHASNGMMGYLGGFAITGLLTAINGLSIVLVVVATTVLLGNFAYWFYRDHKLYEDYQNAYIDNLDTMKIEQIERKLEEVQFGCSTERFITSYLRKKRRWRSLPCQYETPKFVCK